MPAYQSGASRPAPAPTPTSAYNADPNTGFNVFDSVPDPFGDLTGWQVVGGTSAGAAVGGAGLSGRPGPCRPRDEYP